MPQTSELFRWWIHQTPMGDKSWTGYQRLSPTRAGGEECHMLEGQTDGLGVQYPLDYSSNVEPSQILPV